jgi:hypothetical protein
MSRDMRDASPGTYVLRSDTSVGLAFQSGFRAPRLGGHRWLARRFEAALERLSDQLAAAPSRSSEELTAPAA